MSEILTCSCGNETWTVGVDGFGCSKCGYIFNNAGLIEDLFPLAVWSFNGKIKHQKETSKGN